MTVINRNAAAPIYDTFALALAANMRVGQTCIVKGQTSATDGLGAQYEVKANGSGGIAMANGNELVILDGETLKPSHIGLLPTGTKVGQQVSVKGYHAGSDVGGGILVWSSAARHNGVTNFDPSRDKLFSDIAGLKFNYAAPTETDTTQQNQQVTPQPQGISVPGLESLSDGTMVQGPDGRTYTIRGGMAYPQ